ncbi:MAG: hypothetical protein AAGF11_04065 [Myxococcota bacterium]
MRPFGWSRRRLVIGLLCLAACGQIESEEAAEVADATRRTVSRGVDQAQRAMDRVDMDKVRRAWNAAVDAFREAGSSAPAEPEVDPLAGVAEAIVCDAPGEHCTVTAQFVARARQHPRRLARQVRVSPIKDRGQASGIRLDAIDPGSVTERLGLRSGDVVTHVNRIPLGSVQDAMKLYLQVRAARRFVVDYQRGGQQRVLVVEVV